MRRLCLILVLLMSATAAAQDPAKKPARNPLAKKGLQAAHAKPTPEQLRRFNQLQKKQQDEQR